MKQVDFQKAQNIQDDIVLLKQIKSVLGVNDDTIIYINTDEMDDVKQPLERVVARRLRKIVNERIQELTKEFEEL